MILASYLASVLEVNRPKDLVRREEIILVLLDRQIIDLTKYFHRHVLNNVRNGKLSK